MEELELSKEQLKGLILKYKDRYEEFDRDLNRLRLVNDSQSLVSSIIEDIDSLKSDNHNYIHWRANRRIVDFISDITDWIREGLLDEHAEQAESLAYMLLDAAEQVFEYVDDSNGAVGDVYKYVVHRLWVETWSRLPGERQSQLPYLLAEILIEKNGYGIFDKSIYEFAEVLGSKGLNQLEILLLDALKQCADESYNRGAIHHYLESITDVRGDVDGFIALKRSQAFLSSHDVLDISRRLIDAKRAQEALDWLREKEATGYLKHDYLQLQITGYKQLGNLEKVILLLWESFSLNLHKEAFNELISLCGESEVVGRAKHIAEGHSNVYTTLHFFQDIEDHKSVARCVFQNLDSLNGEVYTILCPVAESLEVEYPLAATLLYRKLSEALICRAASKYYEIAARYIKKLEMLEDRVDDWKAFPSHDVYMVSMRAEHKRKYRLWEILESNR